MTAVETASDESIVAPRAASEKKPKAAKPATEDRSPSADSHNADAMVAESIAADQSTPAEEAMTAAIARKNRQSNTQKRQAISNVRTNGTT
jgi:hypothetical protein